MLGEGLPVAAAGALVGAVLALIAVQLLRCVLYAVGVAELLTLAR